MAHMETTKPTRNEKARRNRRREVTIEILRTKHEVFAAAAGEIARRAKVSVTAEAVMAFLLEAECDAKDIADMYCSRVLHWPLEWIDKDLSVRTRGRKFDGAAAGTAVEDFNDETRKATKTAILRKRTIQQAQAPRFAETPKDALVLALNATGRADLATMEALLSRPPEEFLPELKGMVYRNPQSEQWETDDQYLSGDVRSKLVDARAAAEADAEYRENVTALEAVQPTDFCASEVDARLGAVWIPATDIEAFARTLLGSEGITVQHAAAIGTWFMKADFAARGTVANTTE